MPDNQYTVDFNKTKNLLDSEHIRKARAEFEYDDVSSDKVAEVVAALVQEGADVIHLNKWAGGYEMWAVSFVAQLHGPTPWDE